MSTNLGDKVKDAVSGFEGIAIAKYSYLQGCDRICVQPPINAEGKLPSAETFDKPQLIVTEKSVVVRTATLKDPGGPEKYKDPGREDGQK